MERLRNDMESFAYRLESFANHLESFAYLLANTVSHSPHSRINLRNLAPENSFLNSPLIFQQSTFLHCAREESPDEVPEILRTRQLSARVQARINPKMRPHDALLLPSSTFEDSAELFTAFFCVGYSPYDLATEPRLLYSSTSDASVVDELLRFCYPSPLPRKAIQCKAPTEYLQHAFSQPDGRERQTLYLPTIDSAPFLYCCQLEVNPFTFLSICNNFTLEKARQLTQKGNKIPIANLTVVIQTRWPFRSLFNALFDWIIQCDTIGRFEIKPIIESGEIDGKEIGWPRSQKQILDELIVSLSQRPFDAMTPFFHIDCLPFAPFEWKNEMDDRPEIQLARETFKPLLKLIKTTTFIKLFTALLTEQPILVVGRDYRTVSEIVLALHLLLFPLQWQLPSISVLSRDMFQLLESPSSFLYGIVGPCPPVPDAIVILDLNKKSIKTPHMPRLPKTNVFKVTLATHWKTANENEAAYLILEAISQVIQELLHELPHAIVTEFAADKVKGSTFVQELWFATFQPEDRPFAAAMSQTQMMQVYLQFECLKQSTAFENPTN
jgi:hypothetical protein